MKPLEPISPRLRMVLGIIFFILFFALWAGVTLTGYVSPTFLASPVQMLRDGWWLLTERGFLTDIGMTAWRVFGGFAMARVVAVPRGIPRGA